MTRTQARDSSASLRTAAVVASPLVALLALATLLGTLGREPAPDPLMALGIILTGSAAPRLVTLALLGSARGFGSLGRGAFGGAASPWTIQLGLGLTVFVLIALVVGALGLLVAPVTIGVTLLGLGLLAWQARSVAWAEIKPDLSRVWWLALPSGALLLVAALSPPGWLWDSEYGGYDVLSYHLRLAQEWLASGRAGPVGHNVYSYLPSGMESLFAWIGSMTLAPTEGAGAREGLLAGSGWRALSGQVFHASLALVSAWTLSRFVHRALEGIDAGVRKSAAVSGVVFLTTPWVIVVGSMAYNELGVTALGACAMLVAIEDRVRVVWRGALCGALVGGACACKPTAIVLVAPVVGVLLLGVAPVRSWPALIGAGVVAGVIALSPWMVRNAAHGGNPVFPQLTGVFGSAHWDEGQVERYRTAHAFEGSLAARARTLLWTAPGTDAESRSVERWRGALNPQFGAVFPAALLAGAIALARPPTRRMAGLLLVGLLAQVIGWALLTHLQSRFLSPCLLPAGALFGLALSGVRTRRVRTPLAFAWGLVIVGQSVGSVVNFAGQRQSRPNFGLLGGVGMMRGEPYEPEVGLAESGAYINHELGEGAVVLLVGGATPLYLAPEVVYATTWDTPALGEAMEAGEEPGAWTRRLRERGLTHALVDLGELERLRASGWLDPRLSQERVKVWLESLGRPIQVWPGVGPPRQALYRLD
ncbi:MAG: hypothetical protein ACIARR_09240 [Phycisphaerales bacterium JB059]